MMAKQFYDWQTSGGAMNFWTGTGLFHPSQLYRGMPSMSKVPIIMNFECD
jgi:hypothetical protein